MEEAKELISLVGSKAISVAVRKGPYSQRSEEPAGQLPVADALMRRCAIQRRLSRVSPLSARRRTCPRRIRAHQGASRMD